MRAKLAVLALCCTGLAFTAACGDDDEGGGGSTVVPVTQRSFTDAPEMTAAAGAAQGSGVYRDDLAAHYGCTPRASYTGNTESLVNNASNQAVRAPSTPAVIPGYTCAANQYTQTTPEDTSKAIVILVHGNSSSPGSWEEYYNPALNVPADRQLQTSSGFRFQAESSARQQLAGKLVANGYRVYGFDARTDLIGNGGADAQNAQNANHNMDHGWAVPMLESMIRSVIAANPGRKVSLIGHSLGVTEIRDALRRMYIAHTNNPTTAVNPYEHVQDLIFLSGANHGVVYGSPTACTLPVPADSTSQMTTYVNCELGNRAAFQPNYFSWPITGANDQWATPCANGSTAFGAADACGGNTVEYTTIVMRDIVGGGLQDEFVSEASAELVSGEPIDNHLLELSDFDASGYFFDQVPGIFANHFGSARGEAGMNYILQKLNN